ncbi:MAG TPA: pitrilysin family protein [Myxococcales bacterium]|nr:pitrilysin family protein [Myxococcales bacterium]
MSEVTDRSGELLENPQSLDYPAPPRGRGEGTSAGVEVIVLFAVPLAVALAVAAPTTAAAPGSLLAAAGKAKPKTKPNASPPEARQPASAKAFPFKTESHTLPNGLRVVFIPYDSPGLVAYWTLMRVGSRNEPEKGRSGYAHFFEHMMFRGTKQHPADDYNNTVTRLGLNTNAYTDLDLTVYHLYGPARSLPTIIEYEADRFQNLSYDEAQFKTEAGAILGEYAKSSSNPEQKLAEVLQDTAFTKHTYKHTTIGFLQDIQAMPSGFAYSREFFRRYYEPDNATVVVCGDFDAKDTLDRIQKAYSSWRGRTDPAPIPTEPRQTSHRRASIAWKSPTVPRLAIFWHAFGAKDVKDTAVQRVLAPYLFGKTSPLYEQLVLKKQMVDTIVPADGIQRDPGLFGVLLRVKDEKNLKAAEHAVVTDVSNLARGRVDPARLAAIKSNVRYENIAELDKPDAIADALAQYTTLTGDLEYINALYREVDAVRPEDLVAFTKKALLDANRTTITLTTSTSAKSKSVASGGAQ